MQPHATTTQPHADHTRDTTQRFTVSEAAELLGITAEAVRQRIRRGTLTSEKDEAGSVFVFLRANSQRTNRKPPYDTTQPHDATTFNTTVLYERMVSEIDHLRGQLDKEREASAELRRIIAALTQRIPELESASNAHETPVNGPVTASEEPSRGESREEPEKPKKRPWWRRLFQ